MKNKHYIHAFAATLSAVRSPQWETNDSNMISTELFATDAE